MTKNSVTFFTKRSATLSGEHKPKGVRESAEGMVSIHRGIAEMGRQNPEMGEMFLFFQKNMADTMHKRRLVVQMARDMGRCDEEIAKLEQELGIAHLSPTSDVREILMDVAKDAIKEERGG